MSEFSDKVFLLVKGIPKGKVTTYGELARKLGSSPRAVGQALKRNPDPWECTPGPNKPYKTGKPLAVPCHRVVMSDGHPGGYMGKRLSKKKAAILRSEGIEIQNNRIRLEKFLFRL